MATSRSPARRRGHVASLDRRAILQAALRLVDDEGLEALSMRKLGAQLGVEAMTLYYYIPNKAALVEGLAEIVLDELKLPTSAARGWQTASREMARSFRRLGIVHPNVFPLLGTMRFDNPAAYRPTEAILRVLAASGFPQELAFTAFTTIKSFVVGHVLWMLGEQPIGAEHLPPPESVPVERYPNLASYLPYLAACDPDAEFERGLDVLIAGLEALLARAWPP